MYLCLDSQCTDAGIEAFSEGPSLQAVYEQSKMLHEQEKQYESSHYFPLSFQHTAHSTAPFKAPAKLAKLVPSSSLMHDFPHSAQPDYKQLHKPLFNSGWQMTTNISTHQDSGVLSFSQLSCPLHFPSKGERYYNLL